MKKQERNRIHLLQCIVLVGMIVYIGVLLFNGRDSSTPFSDVKKAVEKETKKETKLAEAGSAQWKRYYQLNPKDYEGAVLWYAEGVMDVEEVLLVRVKDASQKDQVEKAIQERLKTQKKNFEGYGAAQTKLLKNAVTEIKGNYIFMAVSESAAKYQQAFMESL